VTKNKNYDGSYDRREAISLAQKLRSRLNKTDLPDSFDLRRSVSPAPVTIPTSTEQTPPVQKTALPVVPAISFSDENTFRDEIWNGLLQWGMEFTKAFWSFVVDETGLLIADFGNDSGIQKEEVISNITSGILNLSRFGEEEDTQFISFKKGVNWTSISRCNLEPDTYVLVGLLSKKEIGITEMRHIQAAFNEKLKDL
jgi:hypothetical protein